MSETIGVMSDDFQGWLFNQLGAGDNSPQLHLGSDTGAVDESTTLSTLLASELSGASYSPIRITPSQISFIPAVPTGYYEISASTFALGSPLAGQVVGCWWIDGFDAATLGHVLWAGPVTPPLTVAPSGANVVIGPLDLPVHDCGVAPSPLLLADNFADADETPLHSHQPWIGGPLGRCPRHGDDS